MKNLLIGLFFVGIQPIFAQNLSKIHVHFKGYDEAIHKNFAEINLADLLAPSSIQQKISENGDILFIEKILETREISFSFDGHRIPILISPNDSVSIECEVDNLFAENTVFKGSISGQNATTNQLIFRNFRQINNWIQQSTNAFVADRSMPEMDYQILRLAEMNRQLEKLQLNANNNQISKYSFEEWANFKIKYAAGLDLVLFPFMGKMNGPMNEKNAYFSFLKTISINEKNAVNYVGFMDYLEALYTTFDIIANTADSHKNTRENLKNIGESNFLIKYSVISKLENGVGKELLFAHLLQNEPQIPGNFRDSLVRFLPAAYFPKIAKKVENNSVSEFRLTDLLENFDLSLIEKQGLRDLYINTENKVVYHDFWFTACPPCIAEMQVYPSLIEKTDENVVFLFLGVEMDDSEWRNAVEKYKLKGKHFLLSKNQMAFYEKYFNIFTFPHHHIVDKNGKILNAEIPNLKLGNIDEILELINANK
jgi:thiol-disulfide isomerase/thioredoxin